MQSSGKNVALLSVVAVAAAAAILFAKKPAPDSHEASRPEQREILARRLPAKNASASGVQHVLKAHEDSGRKVPTVSTAGSPDLRVGLDFSPSAGVRSGRSFNPAGALLEHRLEASESPFDFAADRVGQAEIVVANPVKPRKHVVVDGDTLTGLAARYLGSSDRYAEIFSANRQLLSKPDLLPIGATLVIPPADAGTASANGTPVNDAPGTVSLEPAPLPTTVVPVPQGALGGDR